MIFCIQYLLYDFNFNIFCIYDFASIICKF